MVTAQLFVLLHALGHVSVGDVQAQAVQEAGHGQVSVGQLKSTSFSVCLGILRDQWNLPNYTHAIPDKIFPAVLFQEASHLFTELRNCLLHEFAHHALFHAFVLLLVAVDKGCKMPQFFIDGLLLLRERHFTYRPKHPWHTRWSCQLGHTPQDKIRLACTSWPMFCKQLHTETTYSHPSQAGAKNPEQFLKIKVQTVYFKENHPHP